MMKSSNKEAVYCVDTNILVEFVALDSIPWRSLDPDLEYIRVIVPTKVGEEMDEHKGKTGRLRRRGIEFSQQARQMEESVDGVVTIRQANPRITLEFGPLLRTSDLDGDLFDLLDSDNRIVAEALAISKKVPFLTMLADDSKTVRLARQAGLPVQRPLSDWRRKEGPDERDTEIKQLRSELGAQPEFKVSLAGPDKVERIDVEGDFIGCDQSCSEAFISAVKVVEPQTTREQLIVSHGYYNPSPYDIGAQMYGAPGLTDSQLSKYVAEYERFMQRSDKIAKSLDKLAAKVGFAQDVRCIVTNSGSRAGDKVLVEAEISGSYTFLPVDFLSQQLKAALRPPEAPRPERGIHANIITNASLFDKVTAPRADIFHPLDEPEDIEQCKYISWRCEEFRQGAEFELPMLIMTSDSQSNGLLTLTVSSTVLAKKTIMNVPIRTVSSNRLASSDYFLKNLGHFPKKYREQFAENLRSGI